MNSTRTLRKGTRTLLKVSALGIGALSLAVGPASSAYATTTWNACTSFSGNAICVGIITPNSVAGQFRERQPPGVANAYIQIIGPGVNARSVAFTSYYTDTTFSTPKHGLDGKFCAYLYEGSTLAGEACASE